MRYENIDSPPRNSCSCLVCAMQGHGRSQGQTWPVKIGNGIRLCEMHLRFYLWASLTVGEGVDFVVLLKLLPALEEAELEEAVPA